MMICAWDWEFQVANKDSHSDCDSWIFLLINFIMSFITSFPVQLIFVIVVAALLTVGYMRERYEGYERFMPWRPSARSFFPGRYFPIQPIYPPYLAQSNYPSYFSSPVLYG